MVSVLGMHACGVGVPILLEAPEACDGISREVTLDGKQEKLKEAFVAATGYWSPFRDALLAQDATFFESYFAYLTYPQHLTPKLREFIYIAVDSSVTHLYPTGLRNHIRKALKYGATDAEIMEVFHLAAAQGSNTLAIGIPVMEEAIAERGGDSH